MGNVLLMRAGRTSIDSIIRQANEKNRSPQALEEGRKPHAENASSAAIMERILTPWPPALKPCRPSVSTPILIAIGKSGRLQKLVALFNEIAIPCEVTTGALETLHKLCVGSYCVALIDPDSAVIDGYEIAKIIRQYEKTHQVAPATILAIERLVNDEKKDKCRAAGMDGCVSFPHTCSKDHEIPVMKNVGA